MSEKPHENKGGIKREKRVKKKQRKWEWCPEVETQAPSGHGLFPDFSENASANDWVKGKKVRCPTCNKRLKLRISFHDGEPFYNLPMHKRRI